MQSTSVSISSTEELKEVATNLKKNKAFSLQLFYPNNDINTIPTTGGIYVFWWTGNKQLFLDNAEKHKHLLRGKQTEEKLVNIKFSNQWIDMATVGNKICLYVGKTSNLQKRITAHIKPKTLNIWGEVGFDSGRKPNTVSQMRIGIERIFKSKNALTTILENVSLTFIEMDGIKNCVNRFYLEDLTVGTYFPLLNIDIER